MDKLLQTEKAGEASWTQQHEDEQKEAQGDTAPKGTF